MIPYASISKAQFTIQGPPEFSRPFVLECLCSKSIRIMRRIVRLRLGLRHARQRQPITAHARRDPSPQQSHEATKKP